MRKLKHGGSTKYWDNNPYNSHHYDRLPNEKFLVVQIDWDYKNNVPGGGTHGFFPEDYDDLWEAKEEVIYWQAQGVNLKVVRVGYFFEEI